MRQYVSPMAGDQRGGGPAVHSRRRRLGRRALGTAIIGVVSAGLLLWVAPPDDVVRQIGDMSPMWVLAAIALELGSCLSYVIIFRRFFPEPPRSVSRRVAWIAMGAGAVLPGGNISSAAATGVLLRRHGIGTRRLLTRCAAMLALLTGFGFAVNGFAGVWLLLGLPGGPHDLSHTGIPILVSVVVLGGATLVVYAGRRLGATAPRAIRAVAAGLHGAWRAVRTPHWRLVGVAGFLCLDMAALWAACAATGHPLGFPAIVIAYCIGYLATADPDAGRSRRARHRPGGGACALRPAARGVGRRGARLSRDLDLGSGAGRVHRLGADVGPEPARPCWRQRPHRRPVQLARATESDR